MSSKPALTQPAPPPGLANSYWVVPGRLLAGEHPGARTLSDTTDRLQTLLFAGVTLFIDLSEEGEAPAYSHLLMYAAGAVPINYLRHAISDHGVPESPHAMQDILDAIDKHLAHQGVAYVHGRAGIGRTGMAIGCYLVHRGLNGDEALVQLNDAWQESERSHTCPKIPVATNQIEYIKRWHSPNATSAPQPLPIPYSANLERYTGALLGMAIGEALGALVTVNPHAAASVPTTFAGLVRDLAAGGPRNLPRGAWLSNTAMSWCLAESLLACRGSNPDDQMQRYLEWQRDGKHAATETALDVPAEVQKALLQWQWTHKPIAGAQNPENRDAHPLARTLSVALYSANNPVQAMQDAAEAASTTLQAPIVLDATRAFVTLLLDALQGADKESLLSLKQSANAQRLRSNKLQRPIVQTIDGWWRGPIPPARVSSDVVAVLNTALWAFDRTDSFHEGLIWATNLCGNPTCSGAVFGALAGAYYGVQDIPQELRSAVLLSLPLADLASRLANRT
jgi:ADP-ribosylglycohydrolase